MLGVPKEAARTRPTAANQYRSKGWPDATILQGVRCRRNHSGRLHANGIIINTPVAAQIVG
jgi:hypothetical protein